MYSRGSWFVQALSALGISNKPTYPYGSLHPRCSSHDSCWPSQSTWTEFNTSISGRLISSHPSAAVCHAPNYDADLCSIVRSNWTSSDWRTSQVGGYSGILWEVGQGHCLPYASRNRPCAQGLVPDLAVDARCVEDIQAAIRFADAHELYLVVKNTGHDHLGRSSGRGAFAIWTHHMKGREWHDAFVPRHAPRSVKGVPAVTVQAGEQWLDVYRDADVHDVIVAGGGARTVGAAGGWLLGGGHSPFSHWYGLGVDNLLEVNLVTASGEHVTLNEFTDPEYFWAVRGGGGSAWGVVTSVTYRTHPKPRHLQVAIAQLNVTTPEVYKRVFVKMLQTFPEITDAGYIGYGDTDLASLQLQFIFHQPNATEELLESTFKPLIEIAQLDGVSGLVANLTFPTWLAYTDVFLTDPNVATNIQDASRLLTADVLTNNAEDLAEVVLDHPGMAAGFNFIGKVNPAEREKTSVHPVWKESRAILSLGIDWKNSATSAVKMYKKQRLVHASKALGKIVGHKGGTYINEANPYEPDWQNVFWGANYDRLLKIKKRIDPKKLFVCNRCVGTDIVYEP